MANPLNSRRARTAARNALVALHWLWATFPLMFWVGVWGMTLRATQLLGTFPRPFVHDPYQFGQADALYQGWIALANLGFSLTLLGLLPWLGLGALSLGCQRRYWRSQPARAWMLPAGLFVAMVLLIVLDPSDRLSWFLD